MTGWRKNVYVLAAADFLAIASFTMFLPFLPLYLREMGVRQHLETWAGAIFGASFLAGGLMSPVWGALGDRFGHRAMVVRSGVSITVVHALMGLASSPLHLLGLRMLNGLLGGFLPASNALVAATVPSHRVGEALGALQVAVAAGGIVGPLLGGVVADAVGMRETFWAAAAVMGLATALVFALVRAEVQKAGEAAQPGLVAALAGVARAPGVAAVLAAIFLTQVGATAVQPVIALVVEGMGGGGVSVRAGTVFAAAGLAMALGTPLWSRTGAGRAGVLLGAALAGAGATTLLQGMAQSAAALAASRFGFGFFQAGASQLSNAILARLVGDGARGSAFGLASAIWMLGAVAGPLLGGLAAGRLGLRGPFWLAAVLLLAAAAWLLRGAPFPAARRGAGRPRGD